MTLHEATIAAAYLIESAETNTLYSRLSAMSKKEGNPEQVYIQSFGKAKAFIVKGIPEPYFNSVRGLTSEDAELLDDIIAFYREHEVPCRFDITPYAGAEIMLKLAERGYDQSGFHCSLQGTPEMLGGPELRDQQTAEVQVRKLSESDFWLYGELYTKSFQMPEFLAPAATANNLILLGEQGWHFYLACYMDEPAAVAALYVQNGTGTLAAAATIPAFRGKGCHRALLTARITDSIKEQCDLIVGQASCGSVSQHSMERAGLRLAYTKAIWK